MSYRARWSGYPGRPGMPDRRTALLAGLGAAATAIGGCGLTGAGGRYRKGPLPIATGVTDGVYYRYGRRLARLLDDRLPGVRASADVTTGSLDNLQWLRWGGDRLAFLAADAAGAAASEHGTATPDPDAPIRALARLYDDYLHLVVLESSSFHTIDDLRGRHVSVGAKGSGVELVARRVLTAAGLTGHLTPVRMGLDYAPAGLRSGLIDAFFWSGGLPTAGIADLAERIPIRLIPLGGLAPQIRSQYGPYYRAATIPSGTYVNVDETQTLALANFLAVPASFDDGLAYRVTEILIRDRDALAAAVPSAELLDVRSAIQTDPVPLHPGALRYYRSIRR
ncbi:TAXI family TRAP transporter solute-binding subunit [Actinoallomurus rhizosphaericola]|uniref:TAXI family TRAP transporter solute-binding subunit n=1 Tax=Actinoallomurus rhizosphaericola TaxID=2952536 RepID=UPI00209127F8|nr:TAXI family TRAP transporter solute-binding subunit [Actinoallomurus rhizosphaericola]MCO5994213.1 TAXI family TRAP transporter solute-binding subunit [Actinoallomurus rhizosphaericola]